MDECKPLVVGTPGRMKDMLERGTLSFENLRFRVLARGVLEDTHSTDAEYPPPPQ